MKAGGSYKNVFDELRPRNVARLTRSFPLMSCESCAPTICGQGPKSSKRGVKLKNDLSDLKAIDFCYDDTNIAV